MVERDKIPMGAYAVAGQFQQRPAPRSGGMFQRGDFEIVEALPAGRARRVRSWDFAATEVKAGKRPDWTVGLRMALIGDTFYVEDVRRGQWKPSVVETNLTIEGQPYKVVSVARSKFVPGMVLLTVEAVTPPAA